MNQYALIFILIIYHHKKSSGEFKPSPLAALSLGLRVHTTIAVRFMLYGMIAPE